MKKQFSSATDLCRRIRAGELSSEGILRDQIAQIEKCDGDINAVVVRDFDRALEAARQADIRRRKLSSDQLGALDGLPISVKESFDVSGLATTWGITANRNNLPKGDAEAVCRLTNAGAIIYGKTNIPDGLADCQTSSSLFGRTNNPWDLGRTCGGSSGGSAAAVAAGFTALELGSDLAGSLRVPAGFCGVYSHKPSYGLVPVGGHALSEENAPTDLTVLGPMARSVPDLRMMLDVLVGAGQFGSMGWHVDFPEARGKRLGDFRVGVLTTHPAAEVDQVIQTSIHRLVDELRREGARVDDDVAWPMDLESSFHDYVMLTRSIGMRRNPADVISRMAREASDLLPSDMTYRALVRRAAAMSHYEWHALNDRRHVSRMQWRSFFDSYDIVLCPVHAAQAFPHNFEVPRENRTIDVNGARQDYNASLFWMSLAGQNYLPATVRPIEIVNGLPIGIQIIGPYLQDRTPLRFAELLESICPRPIYPDER